MPQPYDPVSSFVSFPSPHRSLLGIRLLFTCPRRRKLEKFAARPTELPEGEMPASSSSSTRTFAAASCFFTSFIIYFHSLKKDGFPWQISPPNLVICPSISLNAACS